MEEIKKECDDCLGEGLISQCCGGYIENNRCSLCNKFCKKDYCCKGFETFKNGDKVELFVCIYSPKHILELFKNTIKQLGDTKTLICTIIKIIDNYTVEIKVPYKGIIRIGIDEINEIT